MPISLKSAISNSAGGFVYLAAGNTLSPSASDEAGGARYSNTISASGNISTGMSQILSADILTDEMMLVKHIQLSGFDTGSGSVTYEVEIDGEIVLTGSASSSLATTGFYIAGTGVNVGTGSVTSSSYYLYNDIIVDLLVKNNIKVRASRTGENSASASIRYVKLRRD